jgi:CDP-glucose 4,6-dehydratase
LSFWSNRRVLVTGHTGFKGSWLCLWLEKLGAQVIGVAQPPHTDPNLFTLLSPWLALDHRIADITAAQPLAQLIAGSKAEIVIHLAAQALVPAGQRDPVGTFATNVMGTVHVLQAGLALPTLKAALIVTTDKVYADPDSGRAFAEADRLGGTEPYGSSKAAAELAVDAYRAAYAAKRSGLGSARAGNVIGGGDVSRDRLMPDLTAGYARGLAPLLRSPRAVRPWQHVLDCLNGYLTLVDALLAGYGLGQWNFGPGRDSFVEVGQVATLAAELWGGAHWDLDSGHHPPEANLLALDASKAQRELGWRNRLGFRDAVAWTIDWERRTQAGADPLTVTRDQIAAFERLE